jgi:hypothetical protein
MSDDAEVCREHVSPDCKVCDEQPTRCDCGLPAIDGNLCGDCLPTCRHGDLVTRLKAFARNCVEHGDMTPSAERMLGSILGFDS